MSRSKNPPQIYTADLPTVQVSFDVEAFDEAIRSQGVKLHHYRAMRCPVGLIDQYDIRRPHDDHSGCSNGFIYTFAGEVTCLFTGNSMQNQMQDMGFLDGSSVSITLPRHYDGTEQTFYLAPFDRLYLAEESIVVPDWQLMTHHITGLDKLNRPAAAIQDLMDSTGKRYIQGQDFELMQGQVKWLGSNRPGIDPETGKGRICSVRFLHRPYWYVRQLIHEIRVTQAENPVTGERKIHKMPQAAVLVREQVFEKSDKIEESTATNPREVKGPESGSFGPR